MATLALAAAGAAVGSAVLPAGVSVLGATLSGAAIGSQIGALAGSYIDQALFAPSGQTRALEGPRLSDLHVTASTEGAPIPRAYGRVRVGGQVIWAADFEEEVVRTSSSSGGGGGGKGGGGAAAGAVTTEATEYRYYANFAVGIAEGEVSGLGRIWSNGQELDLSRFDYRFYTGSETQAPDSLIEAREGAGNAPAYRGLSYIVFERMPLASFGNRLPQLSFEVYRAVDTFNDLVKAVVVIPGSGEFAYATEPVARLVGGGTSVPENVHSRQGGTDWAVSMEQLAATLPNVGAASLIVSWFGTDLRAANCEIRPGVDTASKQTRPLAWSVAGQSRGDAHLVSTRDDRPAYGESPSDASVIAAIRDLQARGRQVTLTPFILMDVPEANALSNPYDGAASQPAYPWRGRITVDPAPGQPATPDKTVAAASQVAAFVGAAQVGDFSIDGDEVVYAGPLEWSYRRFILHYAHLAKAAGGVEAFVIGTEMRGLSQVRDGAASYPFVAALQALAADVKAVLGPATKVTYAADWSEYFGHQPQDGSGDVFFHLDPLWASAAIDAVGIDVYWPLADWRDGRDHADFLAGMRSSYDPAYLKGNIRGGEGFYWFYASQADRDSQTRTPITDGAYEKPWVFRYKDLRSWWESDHFDRPGGVEAVSATPWVPQSKPIWFMEVGCPAVDKGANQPNVFVDTKSSESAYPHYSRGTRDDLIQRRYLAALLEAFDPAHEGYLSGANPTSSVYAGPMVDLDRIFVYCWDARPFPAYPADVEAWGDAPNWLVGHWLNGRLASAPLDRLVAHILRDFDFLDHDSGALNGTVPGFLVERIMSARDALQPLGLAYFFDALESGGRIVFRHRGAELPQFFLSSDDFVEDKPGAAILSLTRSQESELPASAKIAYLSAGQDYRQAVSEARRLRGASGRISQAELPIVLDGFQADAIAESFVFEAWAARERFAASLPPTALALEPGDVIGVDVEGEARLYRITDIGDHGAREVEALSIDPEVYGYGRVSERPSRSGETGFVGQPLVVFVDLPLLRGDEPAEAGYVAAMQEPWPGGVAVYRSPEETGFALKAVAQAPAVVGALLDDLPPGPEGRIDRKNAIRVEIEAGMLASVTRLQLLAGENVAAIRGESGAWEVLQFETATLLAPRTYLLTGLLRGQAGTEGAMGPLLPAGAQFVVIDGAVTRVPLTPGEVGLPFNWKVGPASRDIGDASYVTLEHRFAGTGLRPLSPVHLRGERDAAGNLEIGWIRRTRVGGDNWQAEEVPLAEDVERYVVDILDGTEVVRSFDVGQPAVTYSAGDQLSDFGMVMSEVTVLVRQTSATGVRGQPRAAVV